MALATGYFGVPGVRGTNTKVHVVDEHKPICGARLGNRQEFQWCAGGAYLTYVDCKRCRAAIRQRLIRLSRAETRRRKLKG